VTCDACPGIVCKRSCARCRQPSLPERRRVHWGVRGRVQTRHGHHDVSSSLCLLSILLTHCIPDTEAKLSSPGNLFWICSAVKGSCFMPTAACNTTLFSRFSCLLFHFSTVFPFFITRLCSSYRGGWQQGMRHGYGEFTEKNGVGAHTRLC